ncbi:Asp-tRNA(Asn)/Glu-tRNA(Gln) amidotransferase subunit GatC [Rhizosphaericola mali]|uniref:Asp-tRNA(Asn)/Glu-tRNA(Gln) amidotransferase subunit GatC n=1 Tax=Rhizosphaericola mali TaxID=2545455 RepID=UPI001CD99BE0|nr:Asp-tRNA(Asn)/Glu-tRNA(Gln) amidotransferase subunit GatC [Rhizosphaericola mali]
MIEITDKLVDDLANLSRLEFEPEQKKAIQSDLQDIIGFMEKLNELDTEGVQPLTHISTRTNVLREDVLKGSISHEDALKNAPQTDGTFFEVPKVINK